MAGKVSETEKNLKIVNKFNSIMVKISSSKSILSYQNGSALNVESRECTNDEGMPGDGFSEEISMSEEHLPEGQNLKSECLDILRKKLISDLSLSVFSTDLENKLTKMEPFEISKERQSFIQKLVIQISQLSDAEKLLLYLKLPSSTSSPLDPLRQPLNPLGNRQEIQQTIVWIKTHLEEDREISIPKQDVYDQYLKYCENVSMKPLSTADFGKVMKQVYPGVRPRRLGTRGNSRYCYSGMRNTCKLPTPILPQSSIESSLSNGSGSDGSSSLSADTNKYKKVDKTKRKCKSSDCKSDKCATPTRSSCSMESNSVCKSAKRLKLENRMKEKNVNSKENLEEKATEDAEQIKEEIDLSGIKCEESSNNSFNGFDIECGFNNDFGIYLKNEENNVSGTLSLKSVKNSPTSIEYEDKQRNIQNVSFFNNEPIKEQTNDVRIEENSYLSMNGDQKDKESISSNPSVDKNSLDGNKNVVSETDKTAKCRTRRSTTFSKTQKNFKKSYVPIQPKPVDAPKLNMLFEQPIGMSQLTSEEKKEANGLTLCEESDSQEPEEEIVRYFKHLDENEMSAEGLIDQAVKNIESSSVQNSGTSQIVSKNIAGYRGNEEVFDQTAQQIPRSQSCLDVHKGLFNPGESNESVYVPRSQSSVELPTLTEQTQQEVIDSGSDGKKKKMSHLRILLEKSITSGSKNPYSSLKDSSNVLWNGNPVMSNAQLTNSVNHRVMNEPNFLLSNTKPVEQDLFKLNNLKILSRGPSFVPQSPNTRTKYFSFTPISPGPQSPLKTPSTPSASPFVSPHNTPVPRSKQNSHNDYFLSPSERKSLQPEGGGKGELFNENVFNFSQRAVGNAGTEGNKPSMFLQSCRPRSCSSTNFCRSKARKNSSKLVGHYRALNSAPKYQIEAVAQTSFSTNSQFPIHRNFVSSDSLSNEVRKFLENNSKLTEGQSSTIRSQSVPLNRMISESTWMSSQVSLVYSGYFNSGSSNPTLVPAEKFPDWVTNSGTNSPKDVTANMSSFVGNGEMANMESGSFTNEVFSRDPSIMNLNEHYFPGDFPPGNEESFSENEPFREESAFTNKIDLNTGGTFDGAFTSDSDPVIADNIKSYLPDFEGLDNKQLVESSESGESIVANGRRLFRNALYEGGNDNLKDPVITSFKPVLSTEMPSCPESMAPNLFGAKMNEDNHQLIEFFDFED